MSDLLSRIETALKSDKPTSSEISALLAETAQQITVADRERAAALDPTAPTDDASLERIAKMTLVKNKFAASIPLLQTKLDEAEAKARLQAWRERYDVLEAARDRLAEELRSLYPDLVHKLTDLLDRIAVNDHQIIAVACRCPKRRSGEIKNGRDESPRHREFHSWVSVDNERATTAIMERQNNVSCIQQKIRAYPRRCSRSSALATAPAIAGTGQKSGEEEDNARPTRPSPSTRAQQDQDRQDALLQFNRRA